MGWVPLDRQIEELRDHLAVDPEAVRHTVLELGLLGCRTPAAAAAVELIELLSRNPTPQQVLDYHVSESIQERSSRLLALNQAGLLGQDEQRELDELDRLEHLVVMLKARITRDLRQAPLGE